MASAAARAAGARRWSLCGAARSADDSAAHATSNATSIATRGASAVTGTPRRTHCKVPRSDAMDAVRDALEAFGRASLLLAEVLGRGRVDDGADGGEAAA